MVDLILSVVTLKVPDLAETWLLLGPARPEWRFSHLEGANALESLEAPGVLIVANPCGMAAKR